MKNKGSKNNVANRGAAAVAKKVNGQPVKPVKWMSSGGRSYMAAVYETGKLVLDGKGQPIPYSMIA